MFKKLFIVFIILFSIFSNFSKENIDAPFVSKIKFQISNGKVLLTWQNPLEFNDYISIYRSKRIIDSTNQIEKSEKIAFLRNKEEQYIDSPKQYGLYYYAILITKKTTNEDNLVLIPYRNYTLKPANIEKKDLFLVKSFSSKSKKSYISLEWNYQTDSDSTTKVMIYRNTYKIKNEYFLEKSIKIATLDIGTKLYVDTPLTNINYYYAIFIEGEEAKSFLPNINITVEPVSIIDSNEAFPDFSIDNFIPLPLLAIKNDPKSGKYFVDPQILKNPKKYSYKLKTKKIINNLRLEYNDIFSSLMKEKQDKLKHLEFHVLFDEIIYSPKEYIIEYKNALEYIDIKDYKTAKSILDELIKEILPDDLLVRVSYYLGLIYYTYGDYYMSYVHLVSAYDSYRNEVFPYLDSIYQNIFNKLER